jgi:hypothetical protein
MITPLKPNLFKWYMEDFKKVDNCRTLRYMTHVVNSNLLDKEKKEEYLNYKCYNNDIMDFARGGSNRPPPPLFKAL